MKRISLAVLALFALLPAAALAAPRDALVEGMAKCAVVKDNGARLSCYDLLNATVQGAAQSEPPPPVAAPPPAAAPPIAAATPPTAAPPAAAAPPPDKSAWYDPFNVFGTSPSQQVRPEQFGAENLAPPTPPPGQSATAPPKPEVLDSITVGVAEFTYNPFGKFLIILDNGQIWQQLQNDIDQAHFSRSSKNTVTIKRGLIGSYNLLVNDSAKVFKVKRLK